uniref:Uncharacterized protein LOC114325732 isoform X1 n=1 Tax=Diabrotica virgifera virgifera TaxID=50390 RepID=A0A6P7F472_DIAVI
MSKTIVILAFLCCIVAHHQCEPIVQCQDPKNPGYLVIDKQVSTRYKDYVQESSGNLKSPISCIVIYCDANTLCEVVEGEIGNNHIIIGIQPRNLLLRLNYDIQIYVSQPEV